MEIIINEIRIPHTFNHQTNSSADQIKQGKQQKR